MKHKKRAYPSGQATTCTLAGHQCTAVAGCRAWMTRSAEIPDLKFHPSCQKCHDMKWRWELNWVICYRLIVLVSKLLVGGTFQASSDKDEWMEMKKQFPPPQIVSLRAYHWCTSRKWLACLPLWCHYDVIDYDVIMMSLWCLLGVWVKWDMSMYTVAQM